ncbi:MAG: TMEM175 family protein [Patescibacteria group bacterium]
METETLSNTHADNQLNATSGLTTIRIQSLSDNIFGFAMTLLVVNFLVPELVVRTPLNQVLYTLIPSFLTYALSFIILGLMWISYQNQYSFIQRSDRFFLWISIFFLLSIVFIPFSTHILALYDGTELAILFYGANLLVCGILLYIHWAHATYKHRLVTEALSPRAITLLKSRLLFLIGMVTLALLLSFVSPKLTLALFFPAMILAMVPTVIDKFTHWWLR